MALVIYTFEDYKSYIRARIAEGPREWGLITRLAAAAGCQRSYLSRVLGGSVHLTVEQSHDLCAHWGLGTSETEYFLCLVEIDRAASKTYRAFLERKKSTLKRGFEDLADRVNRPKAELGTREHLYYSAWYWTAIHMLVSIPGFQGIPEISKRLQLPEALVQAVLTQLEEFGYVRRQGHRWSYLGGERHVPRDSPLVALHHGNWRSRAVLDAQVPHARGLHFSVVQSMSRDVQRELNQRLLSFIDEAAKLAGPLAREELVAIGIDFFAV